MLSNIMTIIFIFIILLGINELIAFYNNQVIIAFVNTVISILLLIPITYPRDVIINPFIHLTHKIFNNWKINLVYIISIIIIIFYISYFIYKREIHYRNINKKTYPKKLNNYLSKKLKENQSLDPLPYYLPLFGNQSKDTSFHLNYLDYILAPKPRPHHHKLCVNIWTIIIKASKRLHFYINKI